MQKASFQRNASSAPGSVAETGQGGKVCACVSVRGLLVVHFCRLTEYMLKRSVTIGAIAITRLSTAPSSQVVHPRCKKVG